MKKLGTRILPILRSCGWGTALKVSLAERLNWREYSVRPRGIAHPFRLRAGTSDWRVLCQIMCQKDLEIPSPIRPRSIIDAGANIGLSSIYFATAFPDAKIVAIEPDAKNFALCQANTAAYPNVICVRAALWHRAGRVHLANPGAEAWAAQFEESPDQADSVPAMTAWDAIELTGQAETDIFKIDIEGSERDLLLQEDGWLAKVRILLVELHERFVPGCEAAVDAVLAKYPVEKSVQGEKVILRRR